MKALLDTHTFLWMVSGDSRLGQKANKVFSNKHNDIFLSVVNIWEMTIKVSLGKLELKTGWIDILRRQLIENSIQLLPLEIDHCEVLMGLPFHHRDPFDRMLIAQAINEKMLILTRDPHFKKYPCKTIW